jgi:two-component system invasion response regulator UvrY
LINVVLVDDHDLVRTGIKMMLEEVSGIKVVGEAKTGEDAIALVRELHPQVVLLDVQMPGIGGLETTRKILRIDPDVKILIVTIYEDELFPYRLLQAGASGYVTKGIGRNEMVQAIRAVHSGQRYMSPEIAKQIALKSLGDKDDSPFEDLSERELQVTLMITKGMRVQEIADALHLSSKTVNSYRYRIFDKLNIKNDVELTHLAIRYHLLDSENVTK